MSRNSRLLLLVAIFAFASGPGSTSAQVKTGTPPFGSFGGGPESINLANLNVHLTVPVIHKAGRGADFKYDLNYDSAVWGTAVVNGTPTWQIVNGWTTSILPLGYLLEKTRISTGPCSVGKGRWVQTINTFSYVDGLGTLHPYTAQWGSYSGCGQNITYAGSQSAVDGSGYTLSVTGGTVNQLADRTGRILNVPVNTTGSSTLTDRNGNQISLSSSNVWTDTLGTIALTVSGIAPNPTTFTYTPPSGPSASYTMSYVGYTVKTNFGCSGVAEYGPTTNNLVDRITLPDGSYYQFTYESTQGFPGDVTGRIASVRLPTGGTISYSYQGSNNGINCSDGSTATLQRQMPDGTWTYAQAKGTGAASTTTITDPQGNQTVLQFQGIYETQRDIYQGAISPSNLLQTVKTCYNGNTSNCTSTAVALPITQRSVYTVLPNGQQSEHDDLWNAYGAPTESDDYDFGAAPHGSLLKKILATYATLGNITAFRQTVTVQDGNLNTISKINYNYDEGTVTATSGTPQHVSVSTPRGNLTSVNTYVNATTFLTKSSTYYDTGNLKTTTDVNGAITTYNYDPSASCGNSFPTSISLPLSLTRSMTWNCTGGVQLTATDENGKASTTAYTDPYFWRPASTADPSGAVTYMAYLSPTQTETYLNFNAGASTVDTVTTLDGLGRTILRQTRQSPGSANFDSVETDYNTLGRVSRTTLQYVGALGQKASPTGPGTSTSYDAMSRPLIVSDSGGGSTVYSYGQTNDVLVTRSPNPTGEQTKRRQFEYDALGRLTSVCELTAGTAQFPGGNCAQATPQTGYWTKYLYDPLDNLTGVTQNAQSSGSTQSRSFVYDWMSRLTSENVPESGQITFAYDSSASCSGSYPGDLVKTVDMVGNVICSTYDALHRKLSTTYPSGSYASVTPSKYFVYDNATINTSPTPTAMANVKNRLAEAYTCFSPCTSKVTDLGLSYSARGETSDIYESTPNSGGYYHLSAQYWENGLVKQLSALLGLPAISYSPDGEGRTYSATASSGQSPILSSTFYSPAGFPTAINFGSLDSDFFSYDSNTNRMSQYQFTVNSQSLTAALGWNANGTLLTQNITDALNAADTQNCTYQYDDLTRLTSANCGSAAAQTFSYDPFGNINKSGSPNSFNATYSTSTNRITNISGFTPTYDASGNVLNDSFHSYTWDADGRPHTIDTGLPGAVTLTYDALGRMVEQSRSGGTTQIFYGPGGQKLALYNGQTLQKAIVPLSGNSTAAYNSSGLLYYGHADYLGSIRMASTPVRGLYFDTAYAPFGETYASTGTLDPAYTGQSQDTAQRQDTAGGLYDFLVREYSTQGRWPSPDPARSTATCPMDPQTQNRYAYVRNNPLSYTDPLGTFIEPILPGDGGGGPCDPFFDPFCSPFPCDPFTDLFCPLPFPVPGGGGGGFGGGGGGAPPERPRSFPWLSLTSNFIADSESLFRLPGCSVQLGLCIDTTLRITNGFIQKAERDFDTCRQGCRNGNPLHYLDCMGGCISEYVAVEAGANAAKAEGLAICAVQFACCMKGLDPNCNQK
jgi:RHS repeat-associated protein